ncbi:UNVERIFIED_CONTAM: hypothetical protein Scaly_1610600 [Sesamum calycinum]|uniref:Uncharacterized protein n=1 Tax=Sesamum calycinum TaxID=2727403 RepID=A0AAW2P861_9LAMI
MRTQWGGYEQMNWDQRMVMIQLGHSFSRRIRNLKPRVPVAPFLQDDIDMEYCKFCGDPRYKPTRDRNPRRKKSPYAVLSHVTEEDSMCHPSDAEAWRHFDRTHPNFALEPRNIRLGLCIDGFAPTGSVRTHDHATNQAFMMRAALMWTVNDLPAYGMASGWSTAGIMGCPICMDDTSAFYLQHGRKACYFDCHRRFSHKIIRTGETRKPS